MRKFFLLLLLAGTLPAVSWATLGSVVNSTKALPERSADALISFSGAVSGTGAEDSIVIDTNGYAGIQFKVVKSAYRGTFKVQGSWDNSSFNTIWEISNDSAAVTETVYWQSFQGYNYYKIVGDPNASNAGTATPTARLVSPENQTTPRYTGYYGIHTTAQEVFASAARTADADTYCYTEGKGIEVFMNATAASSGSVTLEVYSVSPTGVSTLIQAASAITAAGDRIIVVAPNVAPVSTPAAVSAPFIANSTGQRWKIALQEAASNSLTSSVFVRPVGYDPPYLR
jgi:hypothetical protein